MPAENEQQRSLFVRAGQAIVGRPYLGGELQAAFRQGFKELGAALKAFPDAIQVDEPGAAFNPLYRDVPGDTPGRGQEARQAQPANAASSPSQIVENKATNTIHGGREQASRQATQSPSGIAEGQEQQQTLHLVRSRVRSM
jgi:hypothetical protein